MNRREFLKGMLVTAGLVVVPTILPASTKFIFDLGANKHKYGLKLSPGISCSEKDYTRILKANWTIETQEDLRRIYGIDCGETISVCGYKGATQYDAGIICCPFLPLSQ